MGPHPMTKENMMQELPLLPYHIEQTEIRISNGGISIIKKTQKDEIRRKVEADEIRVGNKFYQVKIGSICSPEKLAVGLTGPDCLLYPCHNQTKCLNV